MKHTSSYRVILEDSRLWSFGEEVLGIDLVTEKVYSLAGALNLPELLIHLRKRQECDELHEVWLKTALVKAAARGSLGAFREGCSLLPPIEDLSSSSKWSLTRARSEHWTTCYIEAAQNNHTEIIEDIISRGEKPTDSKITDAALKHGHVQCLTVLKAAQCPLSPTCMEDTCRSLGTSGQHVMRFLNAHGVPWTAATYRAAVDLGQLDMLEFLHREGCPWDADVAVHIVTKGRLEMLEYVMTHFMSVPPNLLLKAIGTSTNIPPRRMETVAFLVDPATTCN